MKKLASLYLFATCLATGLMAQDVTGKISGKILDPSNLGVASAKVTVTNTDRNQVERTITADSTGNYSAPLLPIGTYSVKAEAKGFKTVDRTGIVLNVNDDLSINISMPVGAVTETVEVKATAAEVELGTAAQATTIDGTQIRELALNTRNYEDLVALSPGVAIKANPSDELFVGNSSPSGFSAQIPYAVNGSRNSANNWTVNGADNVDRGANLTLMTFPSADSIAEFKVERSLYGADSGRAGGAQISVVTRSGTRQWHGSLYEFFRNDVLAANNWSNNANKVNFVDTASPATPCTAANFNDCKAKVPPIRWNDFGGTIGGPVPLGSWNKDHNKTFFFFSEEARIIHTYTTFNPTLPTTGMLQGNFTQPVCMSLVNGTCPGGSAIVTSIPQSLWDPNSKAFIQDVLSKLPLDANSTTSGFFPQQNIFNSRQEVIKIDQQFSEKFSINGVFENDAIPTTEPGGLFTGSNVPNLATTKTNSPGQSFVLHAMNVIRPNLISQASFTYSHSGINATPEGLMSKSQATNFHPPEPFQNTQGVVPWVTFSAIQDFLGYGPYNEGNRNWSWGDSISWIKGRHTLKFGVVFDRYNKFENAANQEGHFTFNNAGAPSGTSTFNQDFANFLLGNVSTFSMPSTDITPHLWEWQAEAYLQDDFKVAPGLTLYYGVRYSYFGQPTDANGLAVNFDPALWNRANAPQIDPATGNIVAGTCNNCNLNGIIVGGKNSPFGDKVTNQPKLNFAPRFGIAWDPFGKGRTSIRAGYGIYFDSVEVGTFESNGIFADPPNVLVPVYSNASFSNVSGGAVGVSSAPLAIRGEQLPAHTPYTQNWSLDIQHQIARNMILDVGYHGSKGTHLQGAVDINMPYPGAGLAAGLHQANGSTIFTSTDTPRLNAVRPYPGFNAINTLEDAFDSNYHSLQVKFTKRMGGGGLFDFNYTYSKVLTDNQGDSGLYPQNAYNWHQGEYGPFQYDRTHVLAIDYVYSIPVFAHGNGILHQALGGWEVTGILQAYTGTPFTVTTSSVDPAGLAILSSSGASARPDLVCNPNDGPHQYNGHTGTGQPLWFNTACFVAVPSGTVRPGDAGRGIVRGPGFFNGMNANLYKNFGLAREGRVKLQVRGEAYNLLNWVNPGAFGSTGNTSTLFGEISTFRAARRIQVSAKLTF
jgi:hypothetical protein